MTSHGTPDAQGLTAREISEGIAALVHHRRFEPKLPLAWALCILGASAAPGFIWLAQTPPGASVNSWWPVIAIAGPPTLIYAVGGRWLRERIAWCDRFPFDIDPAIVRPGAVVTGTLAAAAPDALSVVLLTRHVAHFRDAELDPGSEVSVERIDLASVAPHGRRFDFRLPSDVVRSIETEQFGETATTSWIRVEPATGRRPPVWAEFRKSDRPIHVVGELS